MSGVESHAEASDPREIDMKDAPFETIELKPEGAAANANANANAGNEAEAEAEANADADPGGEADADGEEEEDAHGELGDTSMTEKDFLKTISDLSTYLCEYQEEFVLAFLRAPHLNAYD